MFFLLSPSLLLRLVIVGVRGLSLSVVAKHRSLSPSLIAIQRGGALVRRRVARVDRCHGLVMRYPPLRTRFEAKELFLVRRRALDAGFYCKRAL